MKASKYSFTSDKFLVIALSVFLLPACEKAPPPEVVEVVRPIKMMTLAGGGDASTLEYPGTVSATRSVEMGFEVPGRIIEPRRSWRLISTVWSGVMPRITSAHCTRHG